MTDVRHTPDYFRYLSSTGWRIYFYPPDKSPVFIKKLPLIPFSILKIQRPNSLPSPEWLNSLIRNHRAIISYIEPAKNSQASFLSKIGYRLHPRPFLPSKTLKINLQTSSQTLIKKMRPTTRDNILSAQRRSLDYKIFDSYKLLSYPNLSYSVLTMNRSPNNTFISLIKAFKKRSYTVVVYNYNQPIAFTTYLTSDDVVEQFASGSTKHGRKQKGPTLCTWYGITEARKKGYKVFDFGGIYNPRFPIKSWRGFTQFKMGFGGKEVTYPGLFYKWHWPH